MLVNFKLVTPEEFTESDKKYISKLFNMICQIELINPYKIMGFKDINSKYMYCTNSFAKLVGLDSKEEVIGHRDHDMPCETSEFGDEYRRQDQKILQKTAALGFYLEVFLETNNFATHKGFLKFTKFGVVNSETNNVVALGYEADNFFTLNPARKIMQDFNVKFSYVSKRSKALMPINLSRMEELVIFWFINNQTNSEIAQIITHLNKKIKPMSEKTVQAHINNIKTKFGVINRNELYDLLIEHGYDNHIPNSIFIKQSIPLSTYINNHQIR